VTDLLSRFKSN